MLWLNQNIWSSAAWQVVGPAWQGWDTLNEKMESYSLALHLVLFSLFPDLQKMRTSLPVLPPSGAAMDRGQEQICPQLLCLPLQKGLITQGCETTSPLPNYVCQVLSHSSERSS